MNKRLKTGDTVKIISGKDKGFTGKILSLNAKKNEAILENFGKRERHVAKSTYNPTGSKRDIQVPVKLDKLALIIDEKTGKTSRVGLVRDEKGKLVRIARQANGKEIK